MDDVELDISVFTLKQIVNGQKPILYVVHDIDDEWQFLTVEAVSIDELMIISLRQIINIDSSIKGITHILKGHKAIRENRLSEWNVVELLV